MKMKNIIVLALMLFLVTSLKAQSWDEWFNQKKTQRKYLVKQIAALEIYLGYLSKGYSIAKEGLGAIRDIKNGDFDLHKNYFNSLSSVNPFVKRYKKIAGIILLQINITKQAGKTIRECKKNNMLTANEIDYLYNVFNKLLDDCSTCLDELKNFVTSGQFSMKDDERIVAIDKLYNEMAERDVFTTSFGKTAMGLCLQRANEQRAINISKHLNGLR